MPKTRQEKAVILRDISERIKRSKSFFFAKYSSINAEESSRIRQDLKSQQSEYLVAKKTLIELALKENEVKGVDVKSLEGQVAVIFGYEDEITPVKALDKFIKEKKEKMEFLGGILEGKFIDAGQVKQLAGLPSKQELYAQIVGSINAPVSGFVNALAGNLRNVVYVLKAIEEKRS